MKKKISVLFLSLLMLFALPVFMGFASAPQPVQEEIVSSDSNQENQENTTSDEGQEEEDEEEEQGFIASMRVPGHDYF